MESVSSPHRGEAGRGARCRCGRGGQRVLDCRNDHVHLLHDEAILKPEEADSFSLELASSFAVVRRPRRVIVDGAV